MKISAIHFGLAVGGPRPGNMSQNDLKTTSLMMSVTKNLHPPNQKILFRVQSTRLADLFELLNSSLAQSAEELGHW